MLWLQLFLTFMRIGLFGFGGGYAMIPLLQAELVNLHHWLGQQELVEMIAVAEMTPGPVAINMATYTGFRVAGLPGAAAATLGVIFPSLFLITLITRFLSHFQDHPLVQGVLRGLRPMVVALVAVAAVAVGKTALAGGLPALLILLASLLALFRWRVHPIPLLLAAGLAGAVLYY